MKEFLVFLMISLLDDFVYSSYNYQKLKERYKNVF